MIEVVDLDKLYEGIIVQYKKNKESHYSTLGKIYVSTLVGTECDKQVRYVFDDASRDENAYIWPGLEAEIGILIHDKIQDTFLAMGGLAEIEKKIYLEVEGVRLGMKVDGIFHNGNVLEMKTLGPKEYSIRSPRDKDQEQANLYLGILEAPKSIISYFKRDNGQHIKSFSCDFDQEMYDRTVQRICNIVNNKELTHNKNSCRFCPFTKVCIQEGRPW